MTRHCPAILLVLAACTDGRSDDALEREVVLSLHETVGSELAAIPIYARELQAAAPTHAWSAQGDAAAIEAMRAAWRKTRVAYEHVEGAIAPIFADFDFSMDARYDDYLAAGGGAGDPDPLDGRGATGMHAIERILYAPTIRTEVIAFEATLPGYWPAAYPATDAEANAFRAGLVQRLIDDADALHAQWQPAAIDLGAAFQGLVGLMSEQKAKVNRAATGEEESRYANVTLFDLRNNLAGTREIYGLYRTWIAAKGGATQDAVIEARLDVLDALYAGSSDALPDVPVDWSSDMPTAANLATPFGRMWRAVHDEVDPDRPGSIVASMNEVAALLGFPEFIEPRRVSPPGSDRGSPTDSGCSAAW